MSYPLPTGIRAVIGLATILCLFFGGWRLIRAVGHYSGTAQPFIGNPETGCAYPEQYVIKKNGNEDGKFIPPPIQVRFADRQAALSAGYRQCQN